MRAKIILVSFLLPLAIGLTGCTPGTREIGPTVNVQPAPGESQDSFAADQSGCMTSTTAQIQPVANQINQNGGSRTVEQIDADNDHIQDMFNTSFSQCMSSHGDIVADLPNAQPGGESPPAPMPSSGTSAPSVAGAASPGTETKIVGAPVALESMPTAPADGSWSPAKLRYFGHESDADASIAELLKKYGPQNDPGVPAGEPPTDFQVFQIFPNSRTIVLTAYTGFTDCIPSGTEAGAVPAPTVCSLYTITAYSDGKVDRRITHPGCFYMPTPQYPRDGTYFRYNEATAMIDSYTLIDGQPYPECTTSTQP